MLQGLIQWTIGTGLGTTIHNSTWAFPIGETLHFVGLSLLIGTSGLVDLRLLGALKSLPFAPLHRLLVRWGIPGFLINLSTGIMFWFYQPDFYAIDQVVPAGLKLLCLILAGITILVFYLTVHHEVMGLGPGDDAPPLAKVIAGSSLFLWFAILFFGRMIMYS